MRNITFRAQTEKKKGLIWTEQGAGWYTILRKNWMAEELFETIFAIFCWMSALRVKEIHMSFFTD